MSEIPKVDEKKIRELITVDENSLPAGVVTPPVEDCPVCRVNVAMAIGQEICQTIKKIDPTIDCESIVSAYHAGEITADGLLDDLIARTKANASLSKHHTDLQTLKKLMHEKPGA